MSSFFIRSDKPQKRKFNGSQRGKLKPSKKIKKPAVKDEEIESDSELEDKDLPEYSSDEETAQEKKIRLAKKYLAELKDKEDDDDDETAAEEKDVVADRLKQDFLEQKGKLHHEVADQYIAPETSDITVLRGHKLPVTCVVISSDEKFIFSASKDSSIIKWNVKEGRKVCMIPGLKKSNKADRVGPTSHILALAISTDNKFLVSGEQKRLIHVWDPATFQLVHTFKGHKDAVTGLAFRKHSHQLFSCSNDRSVKVWDLDQMSYVETLFGHQDSITAIDSLTRERALTAGGRDGSLRIWKIVEESQLVFHGHAGSIDCVSLINESSFVSGGDDNSICLWSVMKKKPSVTYKNAHNGEMNGNLSHEENWISSVTSLQHSDLIASGSKDGCIRLWKCGSNFKSLTPLFSIRMVGFVNCLKFSKDGSFLVAAVGQEHKLGRWWRIKEARNSVCIIKLRKS